MATASGYLQEWPEWRTRFPRAEFEAMEAECRALGFSHADYMRHLRSTVPEHGDADPKVDSLSFKLPEEYAVAAHRALLAHAEALQAVAALQRKDSPMEATANRRKAGVYIDTAGFFSGVLARYADLHRAKERAAEKRARRADQTA